MHDVGTNLHGYSSAKVELCSNDEEIFVKKTFESEKDVKFCVKMQGETKRWRSPKVLKFDDRSVYMRYISGHVGAQIIKRSEVSSIRNLIVFLRSFLQTNLNESVFYDVSDIRLKKLFLIEEKMQNKFYKFEKYIDKTKFLISNQSDLTPIGFCHGDLTFSNIISDSSNFYFIDFLDGYLSSPIVDISKLIQELLFGWSGRYDDNRYSLRSMCILQDILSALNKDRIKLNDVKLECYITLLRIVPYIQDNRTEQWVLESLDALEHIESLLRLD